MDCDNCGATNIRGIRYKCTVCQDFDLCETCEAKVEHAHCLYKIRDPSVQPPQENKGIPEMHGLPMDKIIGGVKKWLKNPMFKYQPAPAQPAPAQPDDKATEVVMDQLVMMGYDPDYLRVKMPYLKGLSIEQIIDEIEKDSK